MRRIRFGLRYSLALGALWIAGAGAALAGPSGYRVKETWRVRGSGSWGLLALDAGRGHLFVVRDDRVQVIDTVKGTLQNEIPGLDGGRGVALIPVRDRGYATSGNAGKVLVFDLDTHSAVGQPVTVGDKPGAIIYEPSSGYVLVCNRGSDDLSVIEPATNAVVATIPLGGAPEFAVPDRKGRVFVSLKDTNQIAVVDMREKTVSKWPITSGEQPTGIALDEARKRLFVACQSGNGSQSGNGVMIVLDSQSGAPLDTPSIGQGVEGCEFDPSNGYAFASNNDGALTVVHERAGQPGKFEVLDTVPTKESASTMTFDPATCAIYLAAGDSDSAPGEKPIHVTAPTNIIIIKLVR